MPSSRGDPLMSGQLLSISQLCSQIITLEGKVVGNGGFTCLLPHRIPQDPHRGREADSQESRQPATTLGGASDNKN